MKTAKRSRRGSRVVEAASIDNPILNSPYQQPDQHFEIGPYGPTGEVRKGRRPSESFVPIAVSRKGRQAGQQIEIDFDLTGERRERNTLTSTTRRPARCAATAQT
ncbi:MAG: hypothetical protein ACR2JU_02840 [Nocardioidaceae bacterium]